MNTTVYHVECRRYGSWWLVNVPEVAQASTHAKRLDQVDEITREMLAQLLKVPADSFSLEITPQWDTDIAEQLDGLYAVMRAAEQAATLKRATAVMLSQRGFTLRDIATALGCTHQRVQQLIQEYHKSRRSEIIKPANQAQPRLAA